MSDFFSAIQKLSLNINNLSLISIDNSSSPRVLDLNSELILQYNVYPPRGECEEGGDCQEEEELGRVEAV